jgi:two-component system chemotaxis response regulator CheY
LPTESQGSKKQEGKTAGASGWIVKPFTPEQLIDVVKKFAR